MALHKLTAKKVSEMRRLYSDPDSALNYTDLAAMYGVSDATVRHHLRDIRRVIARRPFDHEEAKRLRVEGLTFGAIGARLGANEGSVRIALWRHERRAAA